MMLKRVFVQFFREVRLPALLLILTGTVVWSLTMVKSGLVYPYGMGFWGPNGHDGVWHIALARGLAKGVWDMPIFAGETIKNYHIGFDLLLAIIHKTTYIPLNNLYFQILPPVFAFLIGVFAFKFVNNWTKSFDKAFWSTFFVYFGGNWGWVITLIRTGSIGGESMFWSQQSISTLVNPPFALSLVILFAALGILVKAIENKDKKLYLAASVLFGILIQIKVYSGIVTLAGLFSAGIWYLVKKRNPAILRVFTGAAIISLLMFPVSKNTASTLVFKPFWFLEEMLSAQDRFYWPRLASAISNYKSGGIWFKLIPSYGLAFAIFWFGNLGTRIIKELQFIKHLKNFKKLGFVEILCYTIIFTGILIPTFFIQEGTPWNTIQFLYYSLMFAGILTGMAMGGYISELPKSSAAPTRILKSYVFPFILVLLTLPTTVGTLGHYLPSRPPAKLSVGEIEALNYLSMLPDGIVLTQPFSRILAEGASANPPRPLYLYESTAYVSAYSGKQVYFEDEVNLEITGYEWKERREIVNQFLFTSSEEEAVKFLKDNEIAYIYWIKAIKGPIKEDQRVAEEVFENSEVQILKTR